MKERQRQRLRRVWHAAEEVEQLRLDSDPALETDKIERRSDLHWLRAKGWQAEHLHDALVCLGASLPQRPMKCKMLAALRAHCRDPKVMAMPNSIYKAQMSRGALCPLRLSSKGVKAQLVQRLLNAVKAPASTEPQAQAGVEDNATQENAAPDKEIEADFAENRQVKQAAVRPAAAWQEHSSDGRSLLAPRRRRHVGL